MDKTTSKWSNFQSISFSGAQVNCGIYLIGIALQTPARLAFGRYAQGKPLDLKAGAYLYVGSAYGRKGSSSLGYRLLRHTSRTSTGAPHRIQQDLYTQIQQRGLPGKLPARKSPHWHIDYLLDLEQADIFYIHAHRTTRRIEQTAANALAALPQAECFAAGLGASDHPGGTHLFYIRANQAWWQNLPTLLPK